MSSDKFTLMARAGYASRGVVYVVVGALAIMLAAGVGGDAVGARGALRTLQDQSFGTILLILIALGLVGFVIWRAAQGFANADSHKDDAKGYAIRAGMVVSAVTYALLAYYALTLAVPELVPGSGSGSGAGSGGGESGQQGMVAWLLKQPFGSWLAMAAGLAIVGAGVAQFWKGFGAGYKKWLMVPPDKEGIVYPICAFGLIARGVLFIIIGGFVIFAGWTVNPNNAGGLNEALQWLRNQPFGWLMFAVIAAGLLAFGLYSIIEAIYRRVGRPGFVPSGKLA